MCTQIIGMTGRAGSGKDTGAQLLIDHFKEIKPDIKIYMLAVADILKDISFKSLGINNQESEFLKRAPGIKIANAYDLRAYFNHLGDAIKSYFGKDAWIKITIEKIKEAIQNDSPDLIIITDIRFPIEQQFLIKFCEANLIDFITIKTINKNLRLDNQPLEEHESEYLVDTIREDYLIESSSVEELQQKMKKLFNKLQEYN